MSQASCDAGLVRHRTDWLGKAIEVLRFLFTGDARMKSLQLALRQCLPGSSPVGTVALVALATPAIAQDESARAVGTAIGGVIGLLLVVIIGAIVGWLAGLIVKGHGSGLLGNIAAGVGGSILAGYALPLLGISMGGTLGSFIAALIGAVALILIVRMIRKAAN